MLEFVKKLGIAKLSIIITAAVAVIAFFVVLIFMARSGRMIPMYNNLAPNDKYEVIRILNQIGASYVVRDDIIMVESEKVRELRMFLASEGLPSNGSFVGYEIFNKEETFSTSSFTQNVNLLRALEGELGRTIMSFDQVKFARVHLVVPKRELFSKEKQKATASVVLKIHAKRTLSNKEIKAISNLVASAVVGLNADDVTIVSTEGKALKLGSGVDDDETSFANHEYRLEIERHIKETIEKLVGKSVGSGKVKAEVSVDIDFDQLIVDSEIYDPSSAVMRSTQVVEEHSKGSSAGGNVSVETNIPNSVNETNMNSSSNDRIDETKNYEISKEKRQQVKKGGVIKQISIAVLVDGIYGKNAQTGEEIYSPQDEDTLVKFHTLIASAVGLNFDRGDRLEVINMKFSNEEAKIPEVRVNEFLEEVKNNLSSIITVLLILLTIIIVSLFIIKPLIEKILDHLKKESLVQEREESQDGDNLQDIQDKSAESDEDLEDDDIMGIGGELNAKNMEGRKKLIKRLNKLVNKSPSSATALLRRWMNDDVE